MTSTPPITRRAVVAGAMAALAGSSGCRLLGTGFGEWISRSRILDDPPEQEATGEGQNRDAVQLEIVFAERPLDDPLMGESLWNDLDQVGAVESSMRSKLESHGIRVGHCGATPPHALQTLLGLKAQIVEFGPGSDTKLLTGQRVGLPSGDDYEIQASPIYEKCSVRLDPEDDTRTRDFETARCVLRLNAERLQDGWVQLYVQPEIHHGAHRLRRVVTNGGFALRQTQQVVPVYALRFPMELSVHEMAVIGFEPSPANTLGHHFFVGNDDEAQLQRLIVVRIAGLTRAAPTGVI